MPDPEITCPDGLKITVKDDCLHIYDPDRPDEGTRVSNTIYLLEMEKEANVQLSYLYRDGKEEMIGQYDLEGVVKKGPAFQQLVAFFITYMPCICNINQHYLRLIRDEDEKFDKLTRGWRISFVQHDYLEKGEPSRKCLRHDLPFNPYLISRVYI